MAPGSVAELARDVSWQVTTGVGGQWITAETAVRHDGQEWRIGLTPARGDITALILWSGDKVVDHVRGTEAAMCARAQRWRDNLEAGRDWQSTAS
ncbi:hypothetical protein FHX82_004823 [Amycolatopsis bartoniae]|uniref:hypothetical protein n=1 Tax=Amycolatopsis bartoniae TaxID=941986 RepID=UPI0017F9A97C|nr:hypothetical protein [Amycolatopsis bartoniae]MBB2937747.1 hypothetical protein [Amycolatopsis bartoniae]